MSDSIRPAYTFVLRLWHEPGAPQGEAGWRGQVRLLETQGGAPAHQVAFSGLVDLVRVIRALLDDADQM